MSLRTMTLSLCVAALATALASACSDGAGDTSRGPATVDDGGAALEPNDADEIPCAPRAILQQLCQQCHARPTKSGAPFPLERRSDVLRDYNGSPVRELMLGELGRGRMPLAPVTITPEEKKVLVAWLEAGAGPVPATSCTSSGAPDASPRAGVDEDAAPPPSEDDAGEAVPDASDHDSGAHP